MSFIGSGFRLELSGSCCTCGACEVTNVRVATATAECAWQVCEHCAELFMADGACGVCGAALSTDDLEEEDDASAS